MKKIIILQHGGGRLANQLWNYISILGYCIEKGYRCENPSFFEYSHYFKTGATSLVLRFFSTLFQTGCHVIGEKITRRIVRKVYNVYVAWVFITKQKSIYHALFAPNLNNVSIYLPPTESYSPILHNLEANEDTIYFTGWLFRNPVGVKKHRSQIRQIVDFQMKTKNRVGKLIQQYRNNFKKIVGVHIRQDDYKLAASKELYFSPQHVCEILDQYLSYFHFNKKHVLFIICSDESVDLSIFSKKGLEVERGIGNVMEDLYTLSRTDVIIGADSTFGAFASYYGDIPHIIFKRKIDWRYYEDKDRFFENKYCSTVRY